uniref:ornithine decarboxylase n=1 Tax=Chlamydomonas reinhardtii TaxID=3055 RepID=Q70GM6_CHLRE|nr:ornithine decarboxylase [Chlamydomonas reinhardtii]
MEGIANSRWLLTLCVPFSPLPQAWRAAMPRVVPFYAVKCNPEPGILKLLNALGAGFDCACKGELDMMLRMGVSPNRIIFAHPCKRASDIRYAREHNVQYTTFDTVSELHKIAQMNPDFKCVLRIRADDPDARVPLGLKYGAEVSEADVLLRTAKELGLQVVGVSFHVGSACQNLSTFSGAIVNARKVFDEAGALGFNMELLDIGGGFTGHFDEMGNVMFGVIANTINAALATNFPPEMGVRVIAEPGRYFAETSSTLLTPVYGQRDRVAADGSVKKDYWLTDGLYGSFNCILYDGQNPGYKVVRSPLMADSTDSRTFLSTLWGPTCDSADCVYKDVTLPVLRNGDWLMWNNAGAYTVAGACDFNGIEFTTPGKLYVWSDSAVDAAEEGADEQVMNA